MPKIISTPSAAQPFSNYAQAIEVEPGCRTLYISGQVGVAADGTLAASDEHQHAAAWDNILAILAAAGMSGADIVEMTGYVTDPTGIPLFRQVRDRKLAGHTAAATVVIVPALANPDWHVEIAITAAKVDG